MANYPHSVKTRLTEEQYQKVKNSNMSESEFMRCAVDAYDESYLSMKIKIYKEVQVEFQKLWDKQLEFVGQHIVGQNEEICGTIANLERENENFQRYEDTLATVSDDFEERVREIIPTLQRLKHGENGLTNSNIEFQAKRIGVETAKLKRWINEHHEIVSKEPTERVRCKCNDEGGVYRG